MIFVKMYILCFCIVLSIFPFTIGSLSKDKYGVLSSKWKRNGTGLRKLYMSADFRRCLLMAHYAHLTFILTVWMIIYVLSVSYYVLLFCSRQKYIRQKYRYLLMTHLSEYFGVEYEEPRMNVHLTSSYVTAETKEVKSDNSTEEGVLSSVWHKITNFFSLSNTSTSTEGSTTTAKKGDYEHSYRVLPPETRKGNINHNLRRVQKDVHDNDIDEGGIVAEDETFSKTKGVSEDEKEKDATLNEVSHRRRLLLLPLQPEVASPDTEPEFKSYFKNMEQEIKNNRDKSVVYEFDQDYPQSLRYKRFKDISEDEWLTEKIVGESDPVEDIDSDNYIKEIKSISFPFHTNPVPPLIVKDGFSEEPNIPKKSEQVEPIQIIDY